MYGNTLHILIGTICIVILYIFFSASFFPVRISGPEPGYVATPIFVAEAALTILDKNRLHVYI